jgi:hypothetical protein
VLIPMPLISAARSKSFRHAPGESDIEKFAIDSFAVDFGRTTRTPATVGEPAGVLFRGNCGRKTSPSKFGRRIAALARIPI